MKRSGIVLAIGWVLAGPAAAEPLPPWIELAPALGGEQADPVKPLAPERAAELAAQGHGSVELVRRIELRIGQREVERRVLMVRQYLTPAGIEALGNLALTVYPSREHLSIEAAFVELPGRGRNVLRPEAIQIVSNPAPPIFSDQQDVVIPLPGLEVGAIAVAATTTRLDRSRWPLPWSDGFAVQSQIPIEEFQLRVSWDPALPAPAWKATSGVIPCARPSPTELACTSLRVAPVPLDPDVSSWLERIDTITLAERYEWSGLADRVLALVEGAAAPGDSRLAALGARFADDESASRLASLYRFVADEIRYLALEHGASAVVPRAAADTLERRYGDCKDKVALLLALARGAGLEAWPVLVATMRSDLGRLEPPAVRHFDHMIVCIRLPTGQESCLDPTVQGSVPGELPEPVQGSVALDLRPGVRAPRLLPATSHAWSIDVVGEYAIECDGSVRERLERRFAGSQSAGLRGMLRGLSEPERTRWVEDEYRRTVADTARPAFVVDGLRVPGQPVTVRSDFTFPSSGSLAGRDRYEDLDLWMLSYARGMKSENRHHPYAMRGMLFRSTLWYSTCDAMGVRWPGPELALHSEFGSLDRRYRREGERLRVDTVLDLPRRTLEPGEIPRFNRFLDRALEQTRIRFAIGERRQ